MAKEQKVLTWEGNNEEVRRLFTLTPDDLYFLHPLRVDSQRLYRALVLLWARVERVLLSETTSIDQTRQYTVGPLTCAPGPAAQLSLDALSDL
ncbi:MAG: hypothetical protein ACYDER_11015 [Ktedonobacteraceae bacterium]